MNCQNTYSFYCRATNHHILYGNFVVQILLLSCDGWDCNDRNKYWCVVSPVCSAVCYAVSCLVGYNCYILMVIYTKRLTECRVPFLPSPSPHDQVLLDHKFLQFQNETILILTMSQSNMIEFTCIRTKDFQIKELDSN